MAAGIKALQGTRIERSEALAALAPSARQARPLGSSHPLPDRGPSRRRDVGGRQQMRGSAGARAPGSAEPASALAATYVVPLMRTRDTEAPTYRGRLAGAGTVVAGGRVAAP